MYLPSLEGLITFTYMLQELIKDAKQWSYRAWSKLILAYHPVLWWQVSHPDNKDTTELINFLNSI